jgi:hypothetical protein
MVSELETRAEYFVLCGYLFLKTGVDEEAGEERLVNRIDGQAVENPRQEHCPDHTPAEKITRTEVL